MVNLATITISRSKILVNHRSSIKPRKQLSTSPSVAVTKKISRRELGIEKKEMGAARGRNKNPAQTGGGNEPERRKMFGGKKKRNAHRPTVSTRATAGRVTSQWLRGKNRPPSTDCLLPLCGQQVKGKKRRQRAALWANGTFFTFSRCVSLLFFFQNAGPPVVVHAGKAPLKSRRN